MTLRVIEGGKSLPKFYTSEMHPDDGEGIAIIVRTGDVVRLDDGRLHHCDAIHTQPVALEDREIAEAFCAALNRKWEADEAEYGPEGGAA